jgi:hypothetical protein
MDSQVGRIKNILLVIGLIVGIILVSFSAYNIFSWLNEQVETDYFISGGSIAGIQIANELAKMGKSFVLQEENDWIGGQSVFQPVKNLSKPNELSFLTKKNFSPNQDYLPKTIQEIIKSKLDSKHSKIYLNSRIVDVVKNGSSIEHILIKKNDNSATIKVKAKHYIDTSKFFNLSVKSGVDYKFDAQTLSANTPFYMADKGYWGQKLTARELVNGKMELLNSCLLNSVQECLVIDSNSEFVFPLRVAKKGINQYLFEIESGYFNNLKNNLEIKINDEIITDFDIERHPDNGFITNLKFNYDSPKLVPKISIKNRTSTSLIINNLVVSAVNDNTYHLNEVLSNNPISFESFSVSDKKLLLTDLQMEQGRDYYIFLKTEQEYENYDLQKLVLEELETKKQLIERKFYITDSPFNNFLPLFKIRYQPDQKLMLDYKESNIDDLDKKIFVVPASLLNKLSIINIGEKFSFLPKTLYDIYSFGNCQEPGKVSLTKKVPVDTLNFVARGILSEMNSLQIRAQDQSCSILLVQLSPEHYNTFTIDFDNENREWTANILELGEYELLLNTAETKDFGNMEITISENQKQLLKTRLQSSATKPNLGLINLSGGSLKITLNSKNPDDYGSVQIILREKMPEYYSPFEFTSRIKELKPELRPLEGYRLQQDFFDKQQVLTGQNILQTQSLSESFKNLINTNISKGIALVSNEFNQTEITEFDKPAFILDQTYRNELARGSLELSKRYYFWLKYDAPKWFYGCKEQVTFCIGKRFGLIADINKENEGFAPIPVFGKSIILSGKDRYDKLFTADENQVNKKFDFVYSTNIDNLFFVQR